MTCTTPLNNMYGSSQKVKKGGDKGEQKERGLRYKTRQGWSMRNTQLPLPPSEDTPSIQSAPDRKPTNMSGTRLVDGHLEEPRFAVKGEIDALRSIFNRWRCSSICHSIYTAAVFVRIAGGPC